MAPDPKDKPANVPRPPETFPFEDDPIMDPSPDRDKTGKRPRPKGK